MTKNKVTKGNGVPMRLAVIVSRFNQEVTSGLLKGALAYLGEQGIDVKKDDIVEAPGAFEIPLLAQTLAGTGKFDGVVCLGCVVKGETAHFEYISAAASNGLINASLGAGIPFGFGILATYNQDQARARSKNDANNKGWEAAAACVESVMRIRQITK